MTEETPDTDQAMREALARIAAERVARTGRLSLGSNLTRLPDEIAGLGWLTLLDCADSGIDDLRPLAELTALEILVCFGTQVHDLRPLAGLSALKILYCWSTQLRDLRPLAGLTALTKLGRSRGSPR
jgi:internalin A